MDENMDDDEDCSHAYSDRIPKPDTSGWDVLVSGFVGEGIDDELQEEMSSLEQMTLIDLTGSSIPLILISDDEEDEGIGDSLSPQRLEASPQKSVHRSPTRDESHDLTVQPQSSSLNGEPPSCGNSSVEVDDLWIVGPSNSWKPRSHTTPIKDVCDVNPSPSNNKSPPVFIDIGDDEVLDIRDLTKQTAIIRFPVLESQENETLPTASDLARIPLQDDLIIISSDDEDVSNSGLISLLKQSLSEVSTAKEVVDITEDMLSKEMAIEGLRKRQAFLIQEERDRFDENERLRREFIDKQNNRKHEKKMRKRHGGVHANEYWRDCQPSTSSSSTRNRSSSKRSEKPQPRKRTVAKDYEELYKIRRGDSAAKRRIMSARLDNYCHQRLSEDLPVSGFESLFALKEPASDPLVSRDVVSCLGPYPFDDFNKDLPEKEWEVSDEEDQANTNDKMWSRYDDLDFDQFFDWFSTADADEREIKIMEYCSGKPAPETVCNANFSENVFKQTLEKQTVSKAKKKSSKVGAGDTLHLAVTVIQKWFPRTRCQAFIMIITF